MNEDTLVWLFGLEKFFSYINEPEKKKFIKNIIRLKYSQIDSKPWPLKDLISADYQFYPEQGRADRINFYTYVCSKNTLNSEQLIAVMHSIWPQDALIRKLFDIANINNDETLAVVFNKSQVLAKMWMAEVLDKFNLKFENIILIGGWLTHHSLFFKDITYNNMYSIDPDYNVNHIARIMNPEVKIENKLINDIINLQGDIVVDDQIIQASLVINTSAEHMDNTWFERLKPGTKVLIQSNNFSEIPEHINSCANLPEFLRKYPLSEIYFRGDMSFPKYNRFMSYGVK